MTDISSPLPVDPFYTMLASFHGPVQAANLILNEKNHCYQAPYGGLCSYLDFSLHQSPIRIATIFLCVSNRNWFLLFCW